MKDDARSMAMSANSWTSRLRRWLAHATQDEVPQLPQVQVHELPRSPTFDTFRVLQRTSQVLDAAACVHASWISVVRLPTAEYRTAGQRGGAGWGIGASICGAMDALTRSLAVELAPIRVNAVAPGIVRSPLWQELSEPDREAMYAQVGATLPVGRVGTVNDVARAYLYCMTQPWTTGTVLTVDGGTVLV